jgi:hypothetical protein
MTENEKKNTRGYIGDSLTTSHLEKALTTVRIQQQLEQLTPKPQAIVSPQTTVSVPQPSPQDDKK